MASPSITYKASKTGAKFHSDDTFCRFAIGPVGSGKSVFALMEILLRSLKQQPGPDGIRRTRAVVIRNTFSELKTTTIPTFMSWFGQIARLSLTPPPQAWIDIPNLGDGTGLAIHVIFLAMDSEDDVKKLLSLEVTYGVLDEFVFIPEHAITILKTRIGRYPPKKDGGPTWHGIWGASNPASTDSWAYKQYINPPNNVKFFMQPPGLIEVHNEETDETTFADNPRAENVENLPKDYYKNLAIGQEYDFIKVFLLGQWGEVRAGQPVFPEYNDQVHCGAFPITPDAYAPITIGVDIGVEYNAACFISHNMTGRLDVFDEILAPNMSITEFVNDVLKTHIANKYPRNPIEIYLDPAATTRSASNAQTAMDIFKEAGLAAQTAFTNSFPSRREAVVYFLKKMIDGKPAFQLSPSCEILRKGLISGYKYEKVESKGEAWLKERPVKNKYSHIADALQYACMAFKEIRTRKSKSHIIDRRVTRPATRVGY